LTSRASHEQRRQKAACQNVEREAETEPPDRDPRILEGSRWVKNDIEAQVVREIFEWSAAGYSLKRIAGLLNERRTPPPQKRKNRPHATWCPSAIREMLRRELYIVRKIWNQTKYVKTPGTNKRVARKRPRTEWVVLEVPELQIVSSELWRRVQDRQNRLKEVYADCGRKPVNRGATSVYLLSGILRCGTCDAKLIIVSGGKAGARYGCPQHWNRKACTNSVTIRHEDIERILLQDLQTAVLAPEAVDYLVNKLAGAQHRKSIVDRRESRIKELRAEIARTTDAIARVGHSEALLASLQVRESELREISISSKTTNEITAEEIRERVIRAVLDLPAPLARGPQLAKAKLSEHVDSIRLIPQLDGTYVAEGEWDLLGNRGLSDLNWLRGLDLNQRPLGYEGNSSADVGRRRPNGHKEMYEIRMAD
jgi:site-specific DNA recombinase